MSSTITVQIPEHNRNKNYLHMQHKGNAFVLRVFFTRSSK